MIANGNTDIPIGATWGWNVLSRQRPVRRRRHLRHAELDQDHGADDRRQQRERRQRRHRSNESYYSGIGYVWQDRMGVPPDNTSKWDRTVARDDRLGQICDAMKTEGHRHLHDPRRGEQRFERRARELRLLGRQILRRQRRRRTDRDVREDRRLDPEAPARAIARATPSGRRAERPLPRLRDASGCVVFPAGAASGEPPPGRTKPMYQTADGTKLFVIDGHTHLWDARPENRRNRYGATFIESFWTAHTGLAPEERALGLGALSLLRRRGRGEGPLRRRPLRHGDHAADLSLRLLHQRLQHHRAMLGAQGRLSGEGHPRRPHGPARRRRAASTSSRPTTSAGSSAASRSTRPNGSATRRAIR